MAAKRASIRNSSSAASGQKGAEAGPTAIEKLLGMPESASSPLSEEQRRSVVKGLQELAKKLGQKLKGSEAGAKKELLLRLAEVHVGIAELLPEGKQRSGHHAKAAEVYEKLAKAARGREEIWRIEDYPEEAARYSEMAADQWLAAREAEKAERAYYIGHGWCDAEQPTKKTLPIFENAVNFLLRLAEVRASLGEYKEAGRSYDHAADIVKEAGKKPFYGKPLPERILKPFLAKFDSTGIVEKAFGNYLRAAEQYMEEGNLEEVNRMYDFAKRLEGVADSAKAALAESEAGQHIAVAGEKRAGGSFKRAAQEYRQAAGVSCLPEERKRELKHEAAKLFIAAGCDEDAAGCFTAIAELTKENEVAVRAYELAIAYYRLSGKMKDAGRACFEAAKRCDFSHEKRMELVDRAIAQYEGVRWIQDEKGIVEAALFGAGCAGSREKRAEYEQKALDYILRIVKSDAHKESDVEWALREAGSPEMRRTLGTFIRYSKLYGLTDVCDKKFYTQDNGDTLCWSGGHPAPENMKDYPHFEALVNIAELCSAVIDHPDESYAYSTATLVIGHGREPRLGRFTDEQIENLLYRHGSLLATQRKEALGKLGWGEEAEWDGAKLRLLAEEKRGAGSPEEAGLMFWKAANAPGIAGSERLGLCLEAGKSFGEAGNSSQAANCFSIAALLSGEDEVAVRAYELAGAHYELSGAVEFAGQAHLNAAKRCGSLERRNGLLGQAAAIFRRYDHPKGLLNVALLLADAAVSEEERSAYMGQVFASMGRILEKEDENAAFAEFRGAAKHAYSEKVKAQLGRLLGAVSFFEKSRIPLWSIAALLTSEGFDERHRELFMTWAEFGKKSPAYANKLKASAFALYGEALNEKAELILGTKHLFGLEGRRIEDIRTGDILSGMHGEKMIDIMVKSIGENGRIMGWDGRRYALEERDGKLNVYKMVSTGRRETIITRITERVTREMDEFEKEAFRNSEVSNPRYYFTVLRNLQRQGQLREDLRKIAERVGVEFRENLPEEFFRELDKKVREEVYTESIPNPSVKRFAFKLSELELEIPEAYEGALREAIARSIASKPGVKLERLRGELERVGQSVAGLDVEELAKMGVAAGLVELAKRAREEGDGEKLEHARENILRQVMKRISLQGAEGLIGCAIEGTGREALFSRFGRGEKLSAEEKNVLFTVIRELDGHLEDFLAANGLAPLSPNITGLPEYATIKEIRTKLKEGGEKEARVTKEIELVFKPNNLLDVFHGRYAGNCFGWTPWDMARRELFAVKILSDGELAGSLLFLHRQIKGRRALVMIELDPSVSLTASMTEAKKKEFADKVMECTKAFASENGFALYLSQDASGLSQRGLDKYMKERYFGKKKVEIEETTLQPDFNYKVSSAFPIAK